VFCLAIASAGLRAQGQGRASKFYPDSSDRAETLLRNAANHARDRQWSEAIQIYQRVIEQFGAKVTLLPKGQPGEDAGGDFAVYVDGRRFCHQSLAQLPPEARAIYRGRVDPLAESWYREGARRREIGLLRRVVDQAFCSSWGDDALELLGDLAFQDGRFVEALALYRQLVVDRPGEPYVLIHPDPSVDLARVAAKKLLCRAASEAPPSGPEIEDYARLHPDAVGRLAGRTGKYAAIVAESIASDHLDSPNLPEGRWPTFAGSPRRTRILPGPIDVGQVQWRVDLERVGRASGPAGFGPQFGGGPSAAPPERLLSYHPIVLGDQVIVCDGSRVLAYNLSDRPGGSDGSDGRPVAPAWKHDPDNGAAFPQATRTATAIPRYTLTAMGHRIFARMGIMSSPSPMRMRGFAVSETGSSSIVALDWNSQGKVLWEQKSVSLELPNRPGGGARTVNFEGTPVADERSVYVAVTDRREQTATYVACFDAETGARRWIRYLGTATPEFNQVIGFGMPMNWGASAPGDYHHRLLSLDGSTLYYQTNLGALIALDAGTGATSWVALYPRHETSQYGHAAERDLNPAVVHEGRVIVAPSDASAIFAFDAGSGRLLWKTEPVSEDVKLTHVLGVAKGCLVVTGDRVLRFDVATGKLVSTWPDSGNKSLEASGRGLLAGDLIYWPTRTAIQVLDQRTGLLAEPPIRLLEAYHTTGGNLAAGDGYLIVAHADGLTVFCQNSRLIERYREELALAPDRALLHYKLARAAEAVGRDEMAREAYKAAIAKAGPSELISGIPLSEAAGLHLFRLLVRLASHSRSSHCFDEAIAQLESASSLATADPERLESRLLLADILLDAGRPRAAVDVLEQLLIDGRVRTLPVAAADGRRTIRADLLITDRLGTILRDHGRGVYESFDRQAASLFQRGKNEHDAHVLVEVCRDYPLARVVPDALLALGALYEESGRRAEAAYTYKRLEALAPDDEYRAIALWSTARVHAARRLFVPARDAYLELLARYPKIELRRGQARGRIRDLASAELARPPYAALIADRRQPPIPEPMARRWHWQSADLRPVRTIGTAGIAPTIDASRVVLGQRDQVRLLDPTDGATRWAAGLGSPAIWAGYLADKLIAATPRQIVAFELSRGTVQWRFDPVTLAKEPLRPNPFAAAGTAPERPERSGQAMHDFRVVKGRVFCLRGQGELFAIDGDTGALDWSFSSPPAEINPNLWIGPDRVVIQVDKPNQLLVLKTDDGQPVARSALGDKDVLERPPLPLDDDAVLLVTDPRTVKKFDLTQGQTVWDSRESEGLPVNGPPYVFGDSQRLLVLHDGRWLIRLDPATGAKRWSALLGTEDLSRRPGSVAWDDDRVYCIYRWNRIVTLRAITLATGAPDWSRDWVGSENSSWSVALAADHVVAYPSGPADLAELENLPPVENMPVIVRRRETGALVQRFVFPAAIANVTLRIDPDGALVATPRGIWGLGAWKKSPPSASPGS
jgi:outer membrane protein assembly factor BamB/tetratricopeptide (TPR) repeat protein